MKMTTEIPAGVTTPDNIQTRVGTLSFFDGVPDIESEQKVYNLLDFTHAYQAFLDGTKIASMDAIRKGILEFGPARQADRDWPELRARRKAVAPLYRGAVTYR